MIMSTLQEQLEREIQKRGQDSPVAQLLRNQIAADKSGKSFHDLYSTKSVLGEAQDSPEHAQRDAENELFRKMLSVPPPISPDE
jgi:hypothetical protein